MSKADSSPDGFLSIADISRHFSLPESTTRYYCKRFALYIPSVGEGRRKRYRRETLDVISTILEQMQKSRTASAVEEALQARFPSNAIAITEVSPAEPVQAVSAGYGLPAAALQFMERQTRAMENIAHAMSLLAERLETLPPQIQSPQALTSQALASQEGQELTAPALNAEQQKMRKELDTLKMLLNAAEKTQQADLEQIRQWVGRLIQRRMTTDGQ